MTAPMLAVRLAAARRRSSFWLEGWSVFRIEGRDAQDLLSRLSTNDLSPLSEGCAVTTLFLSPSGRLLHRVLLLPDGRRLRALAEEGSLDAFPALLDRYTFAEDIRVTAAPELAALRLVGTEALELLPANAGTEDILWSRRDFGDLPSALVTGPRADLAAIADLVSPGGCLEAREQQQLRVESCEPAAGSEITEERFPLEAGLHAEISFTKGCYTGQEVVARQDTYGKVARRLVRLLFRDRPSPGDAVMNGGREAGAVTSVAPEPVVVDGDETGSAPAFLALAFVPAALATSGSCITLASGLKGNVQGQSGS